MFVFFLNLIISCWTDLSKQTVFDECVSQCLAAVSAVKLISCRRATSAGLPESCAECILITKPCSRIYNMYVYTPQPQCLYIVSAMLNLLMWRIMKVWSLFLTLTRWNPLKSVHEGILITGNYKNWKIWTLTVDKSLMNWNQPAVFVCLFWAVCASNMSPC